MFHILDSHGPLSCLRSMLNRITHALMFMFMFMFMYLYYGAKALRVHVHVHVCTLISHVSCLMSCLMSHVSCLMYSTCSMLASTIASARYASSLRRRVTTQLECVFSHVGRRLEAGGLVGDSRRHLPGSRQTVSPQELQTHKKKECQRRMVFCLPRGQGLAKSCSEPRTCSLTAPAAWCSARCSHPARSCACSRSPWSRGTPRATSRRMPWATGRNSRSRRRAHPLPSSNPPYRTHPHHLAHHFALSLSLALLLHILSSPPHRIFRAYKPLTTFRRWARR